DGTIALSVVICAENDLYVSIAVKDDGPGISPEYHEKIFQIFQTLQARDTYESTGIGLSLVRKIVRIRGGDVSVDSDGSTGSCFTFMWPRDERRVEKFKDGPGTRRIQKNE
ncbi:MAG: hypothetical protein HRU15_01645, partial [Planctomycetes bacterium]|nr:hypothetical protein [Planctomycetota bacterium]